MNLWIFYINNKISLCHYKKHSTFIYVRWLFSFKYKIFKPYKNAKLSEKVDSDILKIVYPRFESMNIAPPWDSIYLPMFVEVFINLLDIIFMLEELNVTIYIAPPF